MALTAIAFLALLISCRSHYQKTQVAMSLMPKSFELVKLNTSQTNECSPKKPLPGWSGIEIQIPSEANYFGQVENVFMPICGYYKLSLKEIDEKGPMTIHVKNIETSKEYSGQVVVEDDSPLAAYPVVEDETKKEIDPKLMLGSYFNSDLLEFVRFPFLSGGYEVWVEYGGVSSSKKELTMKFQ